MSNWIPRALESLHDVGLFRDSSAFNWGLCINEKDEAIGNRAILIERSTVLTRLSLNHHTLMYSHPSKTKYLKNINS